jgi:hypothetical protein
MVIRAGSIVWELLALGDEVKQVLPAYATPFRQGQQT